MDDSHDDCELLAYFFSEEGFEVISARSCAEALQFIQNGTFDLGLFDVYLGDGTCFDLLKTAYAANPSMAFIVWSGNARESIRQQAMQAGASAFFVKPTDFIALVETITTLVA